MVAAAVAELHHLVLDARAIAHALARDLAAVEGGLPEMGADDGVRLERRVRAETGRLAAPGAAHGRLRAIPRVGAARDAAVGGETLDDAPDGRVRRAVPRGTPRVLRPGVAAHGVLRQAHPPGKEGHGVALAGLRLEGPPIDGIVENARRRAGLEPPPAEPREVPAQALGEGDRGAGVAAAVAPVVPDPDSPAEGRADGEDEAFPAHLAAAPEQNGHGAARGEPQVGHRPLDKGEVRQSCGEAGEAGGVAGLVALDADGADGRPAAGVEGLVLQAGEVGVQPHLAAQGIEFRHEVGFGEPADGRVAGHQAERPKFGGDEGDAATHARGDEGGLASRVAGPDDDDLIGFSHGAHSIKSGCSTWNTPWGGNRGQAVQCLFSAAFSLPPRRPRERGFLRRSPT